MANKTWKIDIEGNQCVIDVTTGSLMGGGCLTVDGKEVNKWSASIAGLPPQIKFEVKGKKAEIKSGGFMANKPMLYIEGKEVK